MLLCPTCVKPMTSAYSLEAKPTPPKSDVDKPRLLIVTDAWRPQINGVARTMEMLRRECHDLGVRTRFITPRGWRTYPMPGYSELRLALPSPFRLAKEIEAYQPTAVHIATEGPLGFFARWICRRSGRRFTTCFHTRYPEYLAARAPIPQRLTYALLRMFHGAAAATLVSSPALKAELETHGFQKLKVWSRGVDTSRFEAGVRRDIGLPRPIFLYVGRVAVDKNIDAFLSLDLPGTKVVVGDGPDRQRLQSLFPTCVFTGYKEGNELASMYASADVFVFPSRTETFGLVILEALAAGTPVAAFDVTGPRDVLGRSGCGFLSEDLREAAMAALTIDREKCRLYASSQTMRASAEDFLRLVFNATSVTRASNEYG